MSKDEPNFWAHSNDNFESTVSSEPGASFNPTSIWNDDVHAKRPKTGTIHLENSHLYQVNGMPSNEDHNRHPENRIDNRRSEAGEALAGKPITNKEDNAVRQRAELISSLKVHRFTKPDQQPFVIDMGTEKITDRRPITIETLSPDIPLSREHGSEKALNIEDRRERFGMIIRDKDANRDHALKLETAIEQLPENIQNFLITNRIRIVAVRTVLDEFPELKNEHPRDWDKGRTWSNVEGTYRTRQNEVAVAEVVLGPDGQWHKNSRLEGVARHETGHAIDHALGDFSLKDKKYIDTYNAEKEKLSPADRKTLEYILQKGGAGQQEAFGELFATLYGGASLDVSGAHQYSDLLRRCFPHTLEVIRNRMESI